MNTEILNPNDNIKFCEDTMKMMVQANLAYIITDPCYIMATGQYDDICSEGCDFEGQEFPLSSTHRDTGRAIVFHKIEGTPNGDGSYEFKGQDIGVDAGMLCIAEATEGDFADDEFGAKFETLEEAERAFPLIIKHF
jgi:hypothetical protein